MFKKGCFPVKVIIALILFASTGITHAALVKGTMKGFIAEHAETSGEGVNVFGLDGGSLLGQSFVVDFYYDTNLAPVLSRFVDVGFGGRTYYSSNDPLFNWLGLSLTVNNIRYDMPGNNRYVDVLDIPADPKLFNTDHLQLAIEGNSGPFDGVSFRRQFLDVSVSLKNDTLDDALLPTLLSSTDIQRVFNSASFRINDFDIDPVSRELVYERYVSFNLDVQSIETAVVPVPAAIWLFGSGLVGLFMSRRTQAKEGDAEL
jgi:hypothetical protein